MSDFGDQLRSEIETLQNDIAANPDPRVLKLQALEAAYAHYRAPHPNQAQNVNEVTPPPARRETSRRQASADRQGALEAVAKLLDGRTAPTSIGVIYDYVVASGFQIGGKDPRSNLSAMMSNSGRFQSHQRAGWTLISAEQREHDLRVYRQLTLEDLDETKEGEDLVG